MKGELAEIAELVRAESGIVLRPPQRRALEAAIRRVYPEDDEAAFLARASDPVRGPEAVRRLVDEVTIQETSFLRDRSQLDVIDWPELLESARARGRAEIRVWVAACATGEEPYTLAYLAREALGDDPPVDILATDISETALRDAEAGRYRKRAVAQLEPDLLERYFERGDGVWVLGPELRKPVRFARHNLVRDPMPPLGEDPFDLVVCRNVLIYFDGEAVEHVLAGIEASLAPGGTAVLGAADALHDTRRQLEPPPETEPPPVRAEPARDPDELLAAALEAADRGRRADALESVSALLAEEPLNAAAYLVRGMIELQAGAATAAAASLRRALSIDPGFGIAAFTLGRAEEALGRSSQALKAYKQALAGLDPEDRRHESLLRQVDLGDIAAACRERIRALR